MFELIVRHYVIIVGTTMALSLLRFKCKSNYLTVIQGTVPTAVRFQDHYTAIAQDSTRTSKQLHLLLALLTLGFINKLPGKIFYLTTRVLQEFSSREYQTPAKLHEHESVSRMIDTMGDKKRRLEGLNYLRVFGQACLSSETSVRRRI